MGSDHRDNAAAEGVGQKVRLAHSSGMGRRVPRFLANRGIMLPYVLGLACFYAWNLVDIYLFPIVPPTQFVDSQLSSTVLGAICNASGYLLVALVLSKRWHFSFMAGIAAVLASLTTFAALVLTACGAIDTAASVSLYRGAGRVFAAPVIVAWGMRYSSLDAYSITTLSLSGFCVALLICLALVPLPIPARGVLFALLLPISMFVHHGLTSGSADGGEQRGSHAVEGVPVAMRRPSFVAEIWRVMVVFVLFGIVTWTIMLDARMGVWASQGTPESLGIATIVGSLAIMVVLLVICLATGGTFTVSYVSKLVLPLVFSGVLFAVAFNYYSGVGSALVSVGYTCFDLFVFVLVASLCARCAARPGMAFGLYRAIESAVPLGALALITLRERLFAVGDDVLVYSLAALCALMLLASALLDGQGIFRRDRLNPAIDYPAAEAHLFADQCMMAIERYGLTKREAEVMCLVARGRSVPHIAERLAISRSTVKTYVARIYQKMSVNDRQEMLDAIEAIAPLEDGA
jgi:DNA-binding CsgD family transcriptional regulator